MIAAMRRVVMVLAFLAIGWMPRSYQRGELVENPRFHSANERFCLVVRQYDRLGDFDAKPAEVVFRWDEPRVESEPPEEVTGALYDGNHLLATFPIRRTHAQDILVADSGEYVVAYGSPRSDPFAAIFRADGTLIRELTLEEVLTPNDRESVLADGFALSLREDILVFRVHNSELRIDLDTGKLLDPKRNLFPTWRVWTTGDFAAGALYSVLPVCPEVAKKARIAGTVVVEVVVAESGQVIDTLVVKPLPFGMDRAADDAAKQWLFMPGRRTSGRIEFHFRPLNDDEWRAIVLQSPR